MKATYEDIRADFESLSIVDQIDKWNDFWKDNFWFDEIYRMFYWGYDDDEKRALFDTLIKEYQLEPLDLFRMSDDTDCFDYFVHYNPDENQLTTYRTLVEFGDDYDVFIDGLVKEANEAQAEEC